MITWGRVLACQYRAWCPISVRPSQPPDAVPADQRFVVELDVPDESPGRWTHIAHGIARFIGHVISEGALAPGPTTTVVVRDRQTHHAVLKHEWGHDHEAALLDRDEIQAAAERLSLRAFCEEFGIDTSALQR